MTDRGRGGGIRMKAAGAEPQRSPMAHYSGLQASTARPTTSVDATKISSRRVRTVRPTISHPARRRTRSVPPIGHLRANNPATRGLLSRTDAGRDAEHRASGGKAPSVPQGSRKELRWLFARKVTFAYGKLLVFLRRSLRMLRILGLAPFVPRTSQDFDYGGVPASAQDDR